MLSQMMPVKGFKHDQLLHNAPAHTSVIVTNSLQKEMVAVLPHFPYSSDLARCDFFFPKLKIFLARQRYQSRQALGSAVYLTSKPKSRYRDIFGKWIHRLKLCISSPGDSCAGMK